MRSTPNADSGLPFIFIIVQSGIYFRRMSTIDRLPMKAVVSLIITIFDLYKSILSKANFLVSSKLTLLF